MSATHLTKLGCLLFVLQTSAPPTHLINVHAEKQRNGVEIDWTNPDEEDIVAYDIERSENGRNFHSVGTKHPAGNNGRPQRYSFFDSVVVHSHKFYRIAARERSGLTVYSQIIYVSPRDIHTGFDIYPNPATGNQFSLVFSGMAPGDYNLDLMSAEGRSVFRQSLNIQGATQTNLITLPSPLAPGIYVVHINGSNFTGNQRLIIP